MSAMGNGNSASIRQTTEYKSRRVFNVAAILLLLSFLLFLCQLVYFAVLNSNASGLDSLPVSIRAASRADYSRDAHALSIPPINENILNQIITDIPATGSSQDRMATLQAALTLPVPTMTAGYPLPITVAPTTGQVITPNPTNAVPTSPIIPVTPVRTEAPTAVVPTIVMPAPTPGSQPTIQPPATKPPKPSKPPKSPKPPKPPKPPKSPKP
jgi:hypothetical protein